MGTSTGAKDFTTSSVDFSGRATWTETYDIATNTSVVDLTLAYKTNWLAKDIFNGTVTVNGGSPVVTMNYNAPATHSFIASVATVYYPILATTGNDPPPWSSASITHEADGTKTVTVVVDLDYFFAPSSNGSINSTFTIDLFTIPRATTPTLSAASADMGTQVTLDLTSAASATFTHDLTYALTGGGTGTIATGIGNTTQAWTVPDFATSVPNSVSGTAAITCVTKSGGVAIGTKVIYLTATVPTTVVPTISEVTVAEATAGIAAQFSAYIQSKSTLAVAITAAGASGSTIYTYATVIQSKSYSGASFTSDAVTASGSVTVVTTVTDSRGRTASNTETITVVAYAAPAITVFSVYRVDAAGDSDDTGNYIAVRYAYSVPTLNSGNTAALTIKGKKTTDEAYATTLVSGSSLTADTTAKPATEVSSDYQWDVQITVTDYFSATSVITAQLPSGEVILDIKADGTGVAFGKTAETSNKVDIAAGWTFPFMGQTNPNLLHNWDFRNPVNQRGVSGAVSAGYSIDRWESLADNEINSGSVKLYNGKQFIQKFENLDSIAGKTVTISFMLSDDSIVSATDVAPTSGNITYLYHASVGDFFLWFESAPMRLHIQPDVTSVEIQAVKMELGSVSTLAYDAPADYTTEFLKCARFYFAIYGLKQYGAAWGTGNMAMFVPTPVPMRTNPTAPATILVYHNNAQQTATVIGAAAKTCGVELSLTGTFTTNGCGIGEPSAGAALSADL